MFLNRFVDNNYGIYKSDSASNYGYAFVIKDNLFKSSTWDGIYCYYYCREWTVENNTFDGDNDQRWGRRIVDQLAVCQALVSLLEELSMSSQDEACRATIDFFVTRDLQSSIDKPPAVSQALYTSEN